MSLWKAILVGVLGAALAALVDPLLLPLAAITVGAVGAVLGTRYVGAQAHFDAVGASFALTLGAAIPALTFLPEILAQAPKLALVIFGVISGLLVTIRVSVAGFVKHVSAYFTDSRIAARIWNLLSTVASVVVLVWSIVRIKERLVRTGAVGIAAPFALGLNLSARFVEMPGYLRPGVDLLAFVYVGCVLVGFHTLASWYSVLALKDDPLVRAAGAKTKNAASTAGTKTKAVASSARESTSEATEVAGEDGWDVPGASIMGRILGIQRPEESSTAAR